LLNEACHGAGVLGIALDEQIMALRADADIEQLLEVSQVVVIGPEERG
jgi:hypothetical protein